MAGIQRPPFSERTITTIGQEQRRVGELLDRLERDAGEIAKRQFLRERVVPELAERVARSEGLTYRGVRSLLHDGSEIAQRHFAQRTRTRRMISLLEGLESTHPTFEPLAHSIVSRVRRHVTEDRSAILPRLIDAVTPLSWATRDEPARPAPRPVRRRAG